MFFELLQMSLWGALLPKMDVFIYGFFYIAEKPRSSQRIGPHNLDVLSIIFGCLLGDAYAEYRSGATRICFQQESSNITYLYWLHNFFAQRGYCNPEKPKLQRRIGENGRIRYVLPFKTWSFQSFNWIHESFYVNKVKQVPNSSFLDVFITEKALAIWVMDDGTRSGYGLAIATNCFLYEDVLRVQCFLRKKYNFQVSVNKAGVHNQWILYFHANTMPEFAKIVEPHIIENIKYKLGKYASSTIQQEENLP